MHARELVELAALVAIHGPALIRSSEPISADNLEEYWIASKSRQERWARTLKSLHELTATVPSSAPTAAVCQQPRTRAVLEEILAAEVLARVWAGMALAHDRHWDAELAGPMPRSILVGQLEARHRVLTILVRSPEIDAAYAVKLNRLRRRMERWSDMFLGQFLDMDNVADLNDVDDVAELAVEPARAREFGEDMHRQARQPGAKYVPSLMLASVRTSLRHGLAPESPNADLNARIAQSVLACFPPAVFDSTEVSRSAWLAQRTSFADDAQQAIEDLLQADSTVRCDERQDTSYHRLSKHLRRLET